MHTYLLSDDDVRRYAVDFVKRLTALGDAFPLVWFTLGVSGDKMAEAVGEQLSPDQQSAISLVRVNFDRVNKSLNARDGDEWPALSEAPVLLIDSAVHSGSSMNIAAAELYKRGAKQIISYSLIVKRTAEFIPNFFGMVIGEHDRALFQLESLPNNRLQTKSPFGTLRAICDADVVREPNTLNCGVPSLDKISLSDLMYSVKTQGSTAMIYEVGGEWAGFLHFSVDDNNVMHIDAVANDERYRGKGIGASLIRWAETYARSSKCKAIELWAISDRVGFYEGFSYRKISEDGWNLGKGEIYYRMRRKILYNARAVDLFKI